MSQILTLAVADIVVKDRVRPIDPERAKWIAISMAEGGQIEPIEVRKSGDKYRLIAGGHRLEACRINKAKTIEAKLFTGNELQARLREIDENLFRYDLTELDRAKHLAERQRIWEELHPDATQGKAGAAARWMQATNLSFASDTADRLRLSERTIQRAIARFRRLDPEVYDQVQGTWLADNGVNLDALVRLPPAEQKRVAKLLLRDKDPLPSVGAALKKLRGTKDEDEGDKDLKALIAKFRTAKAATRDAFLDHLHELGEIDNFLEKKQRRAA